MNKNFVISQNDAKYRNARISLLMIVILSALNLVSIILTETYFLFSAYLTQIIAISGFYVYAETGWAIVYVITFIIGLVSVVPYLICWIFSKKKVGWMIAALVLFSLDSVLFFFDFLVSLLSGDLYGIIDLLIRSWALVSLAMAVNYGLKAAKEPKNVYEEETAENLYEDFYASKEDNTVETQRTLTIRRKKSYVGCAIKFVCFINGKEVCTLKNGETQSLTVSGKAFDIGVMFNNGLATATEKIPEGTEDLDYTIYVKSGFTAAKIFVVPTDSIPKKK